MIHTMPDASVRVTSRFPKGQSTVYLDLKHARGLTLERDLLRPETLILRAEGGYGAGDFVGRYGERAEAEADLAGLNLMLADRHGPPSPLSPPVAPPGRAGRKGWGWKGAATGLALGALGAHFVGGWRAADAGGTGPSRASLAESSSPLPPSPSTPPIPAAPRAPLARVPAAQQPVAVAPVASPVQPQAPAQPQAPIPSFGLRP